MSPQRFIGFKRSAFGFTLAELLIALGILGVVATFTIPKVLNAQQDGKNRAMAKEVAGMLAESYQRYKLSNSVTSGFGIKDLTPYMNYVAVDTASSVDGFPTEGNVNCSSAWNTCLRAHNGAMLRYVNTETFGGTAATNAVTFQIDVDARITGSTSGQAVQFFLYTNGAIKDLENAPVTITSAGTHPGPPCPGCNPPWFGWN
jgi:prepilin-type N-terminal cleavage/methylation domain-containing protein